MNKIWVQFKAESGDIYVEELQTLFVSSNSTPYAGSENKFFINGKSVEQSIYDRIKFRLLQIIDGEDSMHIITEV